MLGRQSGVDTSDSKSSGGTSGVTFDSTKHCFKSNNTDSESEFSVSNSFLGNRSTHVYNHSLSFPLSELAHIGNSLQLFENTSSTDFLFGDLPEIGSFEDVDRMFRRSDSTFGLVDSKEDEFGWLSSESDEGDSGESLQSDFGFPCQETSMRQNVSENHSFSNRNTELSEAPISIHGSGIQEKSDSCTSFVNGLGIRDVKYGSIPEEQSAVQDPGLVGKQVKLCGDKFENPTDALGVNLVIPLEPGSSNVQESSMMKTGADDISLAAASFWHLQLVMEWLDLRTKLCIRDGLYRLARGAEQRINHANQRGSSSGVSFMAEETNSCASLTNMETGTNPIDRSIAQ